MCWQTPVAPSSPQHDHTSLQGDFPRDTAFTSKKTPQVLSMLPVHTQPRNLSSQSWC